MMTKSKVTSLIEEVVIPFEKHILNDEVLSKYIEDENANAKHNLGMAKLSVSLLGDIKKALPYLKRASIAHKDLDISVDTMQFYLSIYFKLYKNWAMKNFVNQEFIEYTIPILDEFFMKVYMDAKKEDSQDDFFMFEEESVDNAIESMHYADERKITALEYMEYDEILQDEVLEIQEDIHITLNDFHLHVLLNEESLEIFTSHISTLANRFFATHEFRDLGYSLISLCNEMGELDTDTLDTQTKEMIYLLLEQTIDDLEKWFGTVFVTQDAVDIHYFDASFLANTTQISLMIAQQQNNEQTDEDDDFLF